MQPQYTHVDEQTLKQIDELNREFMQKHGQQVKHDFYRKFMIKDQSKFKYDATFTYALQQFEKTYYGENSVIIPSTKYNK